MHTSTSALDSSLRITPVFTCAHCARSQRLGARWGAGTADASGRVFCTYECAWMSLLIQEHATATATALSTQQSAKAPNRKQTKPKKKSASKSINKKSTAESSTQQDQSYDAMVGMAMLFGDWE